MIKHRGRLIIGAIVIGLVMLACDAGSVGSLVGFANPTATLTRTPRPTFTPHATSTTEPDDTPTPLPTDPPSAPPTATKRPAATAAPRPPTAKPPPPAPSFPIKLDEGYACPQPNDPVWKITGRIQKQSDKSWVGGYSLGVFDKSGKFLKASQPSADDYSETLNGNCKAQNRYRSNVEVDVSELRMQVPLVVRVIRSKSDLTPLSPDYVADFNEPGNYYVHYFVQ